MKTLHQLFDAASSTYTYVLVAATTRHAVIIDPVDAHLEAYLTLLREQGLTLDYVLESHAHADHITSAGALCQRTGAHAAAPLHCNILPADIQLEDGAEIHFGDELIRAIHTPGHTAGSMSYLWREHAFTGDSLLIDGCGRTDFQSGDAGMLYDSITQRLFTLPEQTVVYPAHDYKGRTSSTIGHERQHNTRLAGKTRAEFIDFMNRLNLPRPQLIDMAVPANQRLGQAVQSV
jgi:sulfur dioxygenase